MLCRSPWEDEGTGPVRPLLRGIRSRRRISSFLAKNASALIEGNTFPPTPTRDAASDTAAE